ncbi:MAG TPA: META domain-containing protein [Candidatus Eisenbacteria bacterium]|nr:META domain-containing protein [Candidatus Eisenbacteria bacterium]
MKLRSDRPLLRLIAGVLAGNLLGVILIACSSAASSGGQAPGPSPLDIQGIEWRAVSVAGRPPAANHVPTIKLDGTRAGGNAGCNSYGADVAVTGTSIKVSQVMQTEMACADPNAMDIEGAFVAALVAAATIEIRDGKLVIGGPQGELVFESGS